MRISLQLDMEELKLNPQYIRQTRDSRLYGLDIPIIGLTGSIATGKSTVSSLFVKDGLPVIDADQLIHFIYQKEETLNFIQEIAASAIINKTIEFKILRSLFFSEPELRSKIETYLYSKLPETFIQKASEFNGANFLIYDVPLLFEKKLESLLDLTITVFTPEEVQLERLLKRDKIEIELAKKIIQNQLPIAEKAQKADFIIDNSQDLPHLLTEYQSLKNKIFQ